MIEVASAPFPLSTWDADQQPFYLELFGETAPVMDIHYAEVVPPQSPNAPVATDNSPVYEYWWTIGHPGLRPEHHRFFQRKRNQPIWSNLADDAAHVYLFFPIDKGWRVKEVVATVKYLSPVQNQESLSDKAGEDWQKMQPILAGAGTVAGALTTVPVVGAPAAIASPALTAISKLQVGNVPSSAKGFDWYVEKVTTGAAGRDGVRQGVMWSIPREMFENLGGRLTGSLAVTFIQSRSIGSADHAPQTGNLLCHAGVFEKKIRRATQGDSHWVPSESRFVELPITPVPPSTPAGGATGTAHGAAGTPAAPSPTPAPTPTAVTPPDPAAAPTPAPTS